MPYTIKLSNGVSIVDIPDGAVDTATTSLNLVGKNLSGYGPFQNANFVYLLENFSNDFPPDSPLVGQLWYDSVEKQLKIYTRFKTSNEGVVPETFSNSWKSLSFGIKSNTEPNVKSLVSGDLWFDTVNKRLNVFDGQNFESLTVNVPGFDKSKIEGDTILGRLPSSNNEQSFPVLYLYLDNTKIAVISKVEFVPSQSITGLHQNSQQPGRIYSGINLFSNNIINGISDQSRTLVDSVDGPLTTSSFVRSDSSLEQTIESDVKVLKNIKIGTLENNDQDHLLSIGNYQGSNFSSTVDSQISISGNKLIFTKDTPLENPVDILVLDGSSNEFSLYPSASNRIVDLGIISNKFRNVYANLFSGNLLGSVSGNITGNLNGDNVRVDKIYSRDESELAIDLTGNNVRHYGTFIGDFIGDLQGDVLGNISGDIVGDITGNVNGNLIGNVTGDLTGNVFGNVFGTLKGNVLASDNSLVFNATSKTFFGTFAGNASTASTLAVPRQINGVSFDGSSSITIQDSTKIPLTGANITGPISTTLTPSSPYHLVNKDYVDQKITYVENLVKSKPLFFSLDTRGLSLTDTGPGSVVSILNVLAPPSGLNADTICRVSSTVQNVTTSVSYTTGRRIGLVYVTSVSVATTVSSPTRNNNLVYKVNSSRTSWQYVSG